MTDTVYTVVVPAMDIHVATIQEMIQTVSRFMYMVTAMKHQINASIVEVQIEVLDVPGHRLEDISFDKRNLYERAERSALSSFSPTEYISFSFTYIEVHVIQFFVNCIPHSINKIIEFFFLSPSKQCIRVSF